jgi:hypothetical protein
MKWKLTGTRQSTNIEDLRGIKRDVDIPLTPSAMEQGRAELKRAKENLKVQSTLIDLDKQGKTPTPTPAPRNKITQIQVTPGKWKTQ